MNVVQKSDMVPGFNHNIKHSGQIYHVQTEDSGVANPHIITHLFVGGNILATKKTSYADIVQADNLHEIVRELMQEQHKAMLRNLINGVYDNLATGTVLDDGEPASVPQASEPPAPAEKPSLPPVPPVPEAPTAAGFSDGTSTQPGMPAVPAPGPTQTGGPLPAPPVTSSAPAPVAAQQGQSLEPGKFPAAAESEPPPVPEQVTTPPPAQAEPEDDEFSRPVTGTRIHKPPAPEKVPAALLNRGRNQTQAVVLEPKESKAQEPQAEAVAAAAQNLPPEVVAAQRMAEKPMPKNAGGPTIFGESLISEKSLDEVILGYLAGDGEGGS